MASNMANAKLIDVVFETLRAHVDGMSPEQVLQFSGQVLSLSLTPSIASPPTSEMFQEDLPVSQGAFDNRKLSRRKRNQSKTASRAPTDRNKKPVNAFMAFRAYISPLLRGIPQKSRSPMLSLIWRAEPRKSQFNLLGSAFSTIRDECKDPPTLDRFLVVASSALSIIPAEQYMDLTGWRIVDNGDIKVIEHVENPHLDLSALFPLQTNVSPQDLIEHCFDRGLISSMPQARPSSNVQQHSMSFAALPQNHDLMPTESERSTTHQTIEGEDPFTFLNFDDADQPTQYGPTFDLITSDQQMTYQRTPAVAHWQPHIQPPILGLDPNTIQDDFDPFSFEIDA